MGAIDFLLNLAGLLLWVSWRSVRFDPLAASAPVTLVGTLRRAEPKRVRGWQLAWVLPGLLVGRAIVYWLIGAPAGWTPKINLELVVLAFRGDLFAPVLAYSCLSFLRFVLVLYFWLLVLMSINRRGKDTEPVQRVIRLHLGRMARWSWPVQLVLPLLVVVALWLVLQPLLAHLGVVAPARSGSHLIQQGLIVACGLILSLKYLLPAILVLHLVSSYVYFGASPFWEFVASTSENLIRPLRRAPLRLAKLDLTPILGVILILAILDWLPNLLLSKLAQANQSAWPL